MRKNLIVGIILAVCILSLIVALAVEPGGDEPLLRAGQSGDAIGVIHIEGAIIGGSAGDGLFSAAAVSETIMQQLRDAAKDDSLKAVIIRINSPGGTVAASQEIGDEVEKLKKTGKKVVISMGDTAASGGYWIAAKGDRIVANPGTVTGSIGVIMQSMNMAELYDKVGIDDQTIKSGAHKDMGSPGRPMTPEERGILQAMVDDMFNQFVDVVAEGRKMEREEVLKIADGRILTGRQAKELGLVDELGNYYDAIKVAAKLAGIKGEPEVVEIGPANPWENLFASVKFNGLLDPGYDSLLKAYQMENINKYLLLKPELVNR